MKDQSRNAFTPEEFYPQFANRELEFQPGDKFNYSNSGYFLLGVIIERITGKSYEQVLQDKILNPLAMHNTGYDHHEDILKNRAAGYEKRANTLINAPYLDMSIPYAAGSMYSTVEDLYLWDRALYTDRLVPTEFMDLYFRPHISAFGNNHYAYGWIIGRDAIGNSTDSVEIIGHGGGINGFNTIISRTVSDSSLIVLLNNTGAAPLNEICTAIRGILYGSTYNLPKQSLAEVLLNLIGQEGLATAEARYESLTNEGAYDLVESEINRAGYQLMQEGKLEAAATLFKWNMEAFPQSFNVYDSYGEVLMNMGQTEKAIEYYKKSIEINPGNQNGIDMLEKMGVDTSELVMEIEVPEKTLDSFLGSYELMPGFVLRVFREASQLKAQATGQSDFDLFPKSSHVFYAKVAPIEITFHANEQGTIDSLTLLQGNYELKGKRIGD